MRSGIALSLALIVGITTASAADTSGERKTLVGQALLSRFVDYGLMFGASAGLQALTSATLGVPSVDWFIDASPRLTFWAMATMSLPMWIYNTSLTSGIRQATLGHRLVGVRLDTDDGSPVSPGRALLRSAVMFAGWELAHIAMFVPRNFAIDEAASWQYVGLIAATGYLVADIVTIIATRGRRSIADIVAGTHLRFSGP